MPAPIVVDDAIMRWKSEVPELTRADLVLYLDGSVMNPRFGIHATAGCAIIIVSPAGDLLGVLEVRLPSRVCTAAEAEARALQLAVHLCPFASRIITDCLALVTVAQGGIVAASAASRPLAGVWSLIGAALDGDTVDLVQSKKLIWMPAHTSLANASSCKKSDGTPVTELDWRANRLADAVAKNAAKASKSTVHAVRSLKIAGDALRYEGAVLGAVTRAANTHCVQTVSRAGHPISLTKRDSVTSVAAAVPGRRRCQQLEASTPIMPTQIKAATGSYVRRRVARSDGPSFTTVARVKRQHVAALAASVAQARDQQVARRLLDEAHARRELYQHGSHADGSSTGLISDDVGRALTAAVVKLRDSEGTVGATGDRFETLRQKVLAKQHSGTGGQ